MTETTIEDCQEFLRLALSEPIGLLLQVSDFARARQMLYRARADSGNPEYSQLQFRASPGIPGGNLIIVKERIKVPQLPAPEASPPDEGLPETLEDL